VLHASSIFRHDEKAGVGRLFKYTSPVAATRETNYDAQGSGANYARDSLKKLWKRDMARDDALRVGARGALRRRRRGRGHRVPTRARHLSLREMITRSGSPRCPKTRCAASVKRSSPTGPATRRAPDVMPLPYYVSPEQMMKDKAEYARKVRARALHRHPRVRRRHPAGRREPLDPPPQDLGDLTYRIAFAGVGKYNEFENLRIAGIRHADVKGYSYSRGDVTAKALGERLLAGAREHLHAGHQAVRGRGARGRGAEANGSKNEIYHILYDGTIEDEHNYAAMGGQADRSPGSSRTTTARGSRSRRARARPCARADGDAEQDAQRARPRGGGPRPDEVQRKFRRIPWRRSGNSWARRGKPC